LTSGRNVGRIVGPSFVANAERLLSLCLASGVRSAFDVLARSFAGRQRWFADESGLAFAFVTSGRIGADGKRSARIGGAFVDVDAGGSFGHESAAAETLAVDTLGVVDAVKVALAQRCHVHLFAGDFRCRLCLVALRAETVESGDGVLTDGVLAARVAQYGTFVNVDAGPVRIARVVALAGAHETSHRVSADGVGSARIVEAFVDVFTSVGRIALKSGRAFASERADRVETQGVPTARVRSCAAFVDILAGHFRIAAETRRALTHISAVRVAA